MTSNNTPVKGKQINVENVDHDAEDSTSNGVPMTVNQMQDFLIEQTGVPTVLRKEGSTTITCPYSGRKVEVSPGPGYYKPEGGDTSDDHGIVIGDRVFTPAYGFKIIEYKQEGNTNALITD